MLTQNLPDYWEELYKSGKDDWSLGKPHPSLVDIFKLKKVPNSGRVLILGAGKSHEPVEWAKKGYETVAVDFTTSSFNYLSTFSNQYNNFSALKLDLFDLNPKNTEQFDIIFEYGCFSALHLGKRDEYFEVWERMLKDGGIILSFFYLLSEIDLSGPPHSSTENELNARLYGLFDVIKKIPLKKTPPGRQGKEELWIMKKI